MSYRLFFITLSDIQHIKLAIEKLTDSQIERVLLLAFRELGNYIFNKE